MNDTVHRGVLAEIDREIVRATQGGLPLVARPYHAVAHAIGIAPELVINRIETMLAEGRIRRIGVVPNHYALGYRANGMSVWDVADDRVDELGLRVGALDCVSHCYRRPRHLPQWRYNLFAMVHGRDRDEVGIKVGRVAAILGDAAKAHDVLYSTRILKKTGLRLGNAAPKRTPLPPGEGQG
ncbi:MAG TPA: Lrp/AsnC family transcriptional regulator [Casimicrobiaceae bacterium]|nr:Lrp/AsnC family transcriptional regulator [Casimicrobiaceae bacterium]